MAYSDPMVSQLRAPGLYARPLPPMPPMQQQVPSYYSPMMAPPQSMTQTIRLGDASVEHPETDDAGVRIVMIVIVSIAFLILISHIGIMNLSTISGK